MFLQTVKWENIIEHVTRIWIMIIEMLALNSKHRTNRKKRKYRKVTKTSFPRE